MKKNGHWTYLSIIEDFIGDLLRSVKKSPVKLQRISKFLTLANKRKAEQDKAGGLSGGLTFFEALSY